MTQTYALLRGGYWQRATWKEACEHYIAHRPKSMWETTKGKKF